MSDYARMLYTVMFSRMPLAVPALLVEADCLDHHSGHLRYTVVHLKYTLVHLKYIGR